jgi:hypothetical protein
VTGISWKRRLLKNLMFGKVERCLMGGGILINASLSNSIIYCMSMFLLPKTTIKNLDKQRREFYWQGGATRKKYHLIKWSKICKDKKKGGLGVKDLRKMNISLLCKWWWLLESGDGLWQEIVKLKYIYNTSVCLVQSRLNDSPYWKELMRIRPIYLAGRGYEINNGKLMSF